VGMSPSWGFYDCICYHTPPAMLCCPSCVVFIVAFLKNMCNIMTYLDDDSVSGYTDIGSLYHIRSTRTHELSYQPLFCLLFPTITMLISAMNNRRLLILDGGLVSARGCTAGFASNLTATALQGTSLKDVFKQDVSGPLWSARVIDESPETIVNAHLAFMRAGADVILTATYALIFL
jgi:hypothetical protein